MAISDRYEDLDVLQSTPTGTTYRARHIALGRPVLIRTLDLERVERSDLDAVREAVSRTGQLVHPNILSVVDAEFEDEFYYVTDNIVDSLHDRIDQAPFDVDTVARWGLGLLRAIGHAHSHGVLHRGLSPWRVHFDQVGTVLVSDFGLSTAIKDKATGTLIFEADATGYLPVAVLRNPGAYDEAADRFGAAAMLAHLLTGVIPESAAIDIGKARGDVPADVVDALTALLTARGDAAQLDAATAAFKRWVDSLGPGPGIASSDPKRAKTSRSKPALSREIEPEALVQPLPVESEQQPEPEADDESEIEDEPEAEEPEADEPEADEPEAEEPEAEEPEAESDASAADRAQSKLDKYAGLFD